MLITCGSSVVLLLVVGVAGKLLPQAARNSRIASSDDTRGIC